MKGLRPWSFRRPRSWAGEILPVFVFTRFRRQGNGGIARSRRYNPTRACKQVNVYPGSVICTFALPSPASNFTSDFVGVKTLQTLITRSEKKCGFNASVRSLSQCSNDRLLCLVYYRGDLAAGHHGTVSGGRQLEGPARDAQA